MTLLLTLLILATASLAFAHDDAPVHDNMCHAPHVGTETQGWWCNSPADWINGYWAHENHYESNPEHDRDELHTYLPALTQDAYISETFEAWQEGGGQTHEDWRTVRADHHENWKESSAIRCAHFWHRHRNSNLLPISGPEHDHFKYLNTDGDCVSGAHDSVHTIGG